MRQRLIPCHAEVVKVWHLFAPTRTD